MKNILFTILVLFVFSLNSEAIEWVNLTSDAGKAVALDKDSITTKGHYYFYNIKFANNNGETIVATAQSGIHKSFSSIINKYTVDEYIRLNGDYSNITKNMTTDLQTVNYHSRLYSAYREVCHILQQKNRPLITF